jgi:BNR repeat protein
MPKILESTHLLSAVLAILAVAHFGRAASPPQPVEVKGGMGYVARLADGRLIAVHGECRPREKWDDASIAQPVFGRFSSNGGKTWSPDSLLFNSPGPGWLHTVLPLGERDGTIHLLGLIVDHLSSPMDWTKARADFWHTTSKDAGKTWKTPRRIGLEHRFTGQINSGIQLRSGRLVIAYSYLDDKRAIGYFVSHAIYSDDHGDTWKSSKNDVPVASGGKLLESGAAEPVIVQLADGRIWMVIRTQTGYLFESYSTDGGETWSSARRTFFRASNAPAAVLQTDGRLFLAWSNEMGEPFRGSVSYARQSLVMAVRQGDEWVGYRQVNPPFAPEDVKGTARYPFLVDAGDGKVLFGYREDGRLSFDSQRSEAPCTTYWNGGTRLFRVDPKWLLESEASEDFSQGLKNLQASATAGVQVTAGPEGKHALHLTKTKADQPAGVAWNFPFSTKGSLDLRLRIEPGYQGGHFTLSEYYLNPTHSQGGTFRWMIDSELNLKLKYANDGPYKQVEEKTIQGDNISTPLQAGRWHDLRIDWDAELNVANLWVDGRYAGTLLGLENARGIGYLRLSSAAATTDQKGLWIGHLHSQSQP